MIVPGLGSTGPALGLPAPPAPPVPDVRRIAVLRANGLGDYVVAEPALAALRATYPDAEVTLLGAQHHVGLLAGRPSPVDRVVTVPLMPGVRVGPDPDASEDEVEAWAPSSGRTATTSRSRCTAAGGTPTRCCCDWAPA